MDVRFARNNERDVTGVKVTTNYGTLVFASGEELSAVVSQLSFLASQPWPPSEAVEADERDRQQDARDVLIDERSGPSAGLPRRDLSVHEAKRLLNV